MNFSANITTEDFIHFQRYAAGGVNNLPALKWKTMTFSIVYWFLLGILIFLLFSQYENAYGSEKTRLAITGFIFTIWLVASLFWQRYYFTQFARAGIEADRTVIGSFHFIANELGLEEKSECCTSFFSWKAFESAEEDERSLYLLTGRMKAVIVPKSQVSDEVIALLKEKIINHSKMK